MFCVADPNSDNPSKRRVDPNLKDKVYELVHRRGPR